MTASEATLPSQASWKREVRRFIEAGGNTTHAFGLGRLIGRMFALLYLSPRPRCLEDIATSLDISKASASMTIRQLEGWHAVRHVPVEGDRRDFYEAETAFRHILKQGLLPGIRKKLATAGGQITRTLAAGENAGCQPGESHDEIQMIRRRLRTAAGLHKKLDGLLSSRLLDKLI